ncbi:SAP domain-containing protein, partial [Toxoplasma gondii p89]
MLHRISLLELSLRFLDTVRFSDIARCTDIGTLTHRRSRLVQRHFHLEHFAILVRRALPLPRRVVFRLSLQERRRFLLQLERNAVVATERTRDRDSLRSSFSFCRTSLSLFQCMLALLLSLSSVVRFFLFLVTSKVLLFRRIFPASPSFLCVLPLLPPFLGFRPSPTNFSRHLSLSRVSPSRLLSRAFVSFTSFTVESLSPESLSPSRRSFLSLLFSPVFPVLLCFLKMPSAEGNAATQGASYASMKVQELKDLLSQRGLPTTGKKTDLVERLLQADVAAGSEKAAPLAVDASLLSSAPLEAAHADAHAGGLELSGSFEAKEAAFLEGLSESGAAALSAEGSAGAKAACGVPAGSTEKPAGQAPAIENIKITQSMTEEERRALRKAKFGTKTDDEKKLDRARRFGLSVPELEEEKKRLRAERFGSASGAAKTSSIQSL